MVGLFFPGSADVIDLDEDLNGVVSFIADLDLSLGPAVGLAAGATFGGFPLVEFTFGLGFGGGVGGLGGVFAVVPYLTLLLALAICCCNSSCLCFLLGFSWFSARACRGWQRFRPTPGSDWAFWPSSWCL